VHRFVRKDGSFEDVVQGQVGEKEDVRELVPSPDGAQLAVTVEAHNGVSSLLRLEATSLRELRRTPGAFLPRFARDAQVFAYLSQKAGRAEALVVEHAGTGAEIARLDPMDALALTPDGRYVVGREGRELVQQRIADAVVVAAGLTDDFLNLARTSSDAALSAFAPPRSRGIVVASPFAKGSLDTLDGRWSRHLTFGADGRSLYAMGAEGSLVRWKLQAPPKPDASLFKVSVLSADGVQARVADKHAAFDACFAKAKSPGKEIVLRLYITSMGKVVSTGAEGGLNGTPLGDCLTSVAMRLEFPSSGADASRRGKGVVANPYRVRVHAP
jgi:hypothetical protein